MLGEAGHAAGCRWRGPAENDYRLGMSALLLALVAALGFAGATLLVATALGRSRAFHHISVVVAAGILLGVAFADLIPEAFELTSASNAALAIMGGFLALYLVEALTKGHTHHHEPHGHAHAHSHAATPAAAPGEPDAEDCPPPHPVAPFLLGLGLHNLADGVVIGASHEASDAAATGVAAGILVHQLPVGLSFAAVLLASGVARGRMRIQAILVAAMIPLGSALVLLAPALAGETLAYLIGAAAGALLYIATGHLLPEAHSEERRPLVAAAFTTALIGTVLFVGALHDSAHGHEGGDDPHAEEEGEHADEDEGEHADEEEEDHAGE